MNDLLYLVRSWVRHFVLAVHYPKAAVGAVLQALPSRGPVRWETKCTEDRHATKEAAKKRGEAVGWANSGREITLCVFNKPLLTVTLSEGAESNVQQFFFSRPVAHIRRALSVFAELGVPLPLKKGATIFEPGCNAGRYLYYLADRYDCRVVGADIFEPAITVARHANICGDAKFTAADLVRSGFLELFADQHFDLVMCSSHLAHIVHLHTEFEGYLLRLRRITKVMIFLENAAPGLEETARRLGFQVTTRDGVLYGYHHSEGGR